MVERWVKYSCENCDWEDVVPEGTDEDKLAERHKIFSSDHVVSIREVERVTM